MKMLSGIFLQAALAAALANPAWAGPLNKLADKLADGIKNYPNKKIAVLNFPYPEGAVSSGSSIVQERLTTFLVENGSVEVIERSLLKKVMEEMKLGSAGVLDPDTTKELGKILGVGAIVTGTLNDMKDNEAEVNARVIETETGKILTAAQAKIERTWTDPPVKPGDSGTVIQSSQTLTSGQGQYLGKSLVQIAVLLDTSNSMDGLINQARTQLWRIVNSFVAAEKDGASPEIQVALYEYGNDNLSADEGYTRLVVPFTTELDRVSESLFALKTRGGQEYCGYAINDAVTRLKWDAHADVYKAIFIAGNEPFTQGSVNFQEAANKAVAKGIYVNTIFCGSRQEGIATQWKAAADITQGDYSSIDQGIQVAVITAPQDSEISRLNAELNRTFVPYEKEGYKARGIQYEQDRLLAGAAPAAATERSAFKASRQYTKGISWDLANALNSGQVKPEAVKKEALPQELREMSAEELRNYAKKKTSEREELQKRILGLNAARQKYIAGAEQKQAALGGPVSFDQAVLNSIRNQAVKKGFTFKKD